MPNTTYSALFRTVAATVTAAAGLVLAGCSTGLTEEQLAMQDAGPYVEAGSTKALEACSMVANLKKSVDDGALDVADIEFENSFATAILEAAQLGYLAVEQSTRYSEIYASIASVDAAVLNGDLSAVFVLLDDAADQCSNMTVVDNSFLKERGIDITPGSLPNIK